jgi:transcription termination factor Rho
MTIPFSGILEIDRQNRGFIREFSMTLAPSAGDIFVPPAIIAKYNLRSGVSLEGVAENASKNQFPPNRNRRRHEREKRGPEAVTVSMINGTTPDQWKSIKEFSSHAAISPNERIILEGPKSDQSMRVIDLFCPLGKGQRALIVSPPKAGKTILLQQIATALNANYPEIELIVLLIDERPEEVTDIRRSIKGEVFASSNDNDHASHVRLANIVPEYAKRKVEAGKDVVVLLDSLTRLGRAFNVHQKSSGRTMSGGVDIHALEVPKRIFGSARKFEDGGSLTIIATILVDTGSRMDELIFQEFKGTGNMELVLDRDLANERIFPAMNLNMSGTRREELLFGNDLNAHQSLRKAIARLSSRQAMTDIKRMLSRYPTNSKLLTSF